MNPRESPDTGSARSSEGRGGRKWTLLAVKAAVSVLALWLILRGLDLDRILGLVAGSRKLPWIGAFVLLVVSQVLSVFRWGILLRPLGFAMSWGRVFAVYFVGMFFSLFLPSVVGGDAIKTYYVAGSWKRAPAALYTLLADRTLGLAAQQFYALLGLILTSSFLPGWLILSLLAFILALYLGLILLPRLSGPFLRMVKRLRELPSETLFTYWHNPGPAYRAWAISLAAHLCLVMAHVLIGLSLSLEVPWGAFLVVYPVSSIAAFLPVSLNGIGLREVTYVYMLGLYGVPAEAAFSFGVMWFAIVLGNGLLGGLPYLFGGSLRAEGGDVS